MIIIIQAKLLMTCCCTLRLEVLTDWKRALLLLLSSSLSALCEFVLCGTRRPPSTSFPPLPFPSLGSSRSSFPPSPLFPDSFLLAFSSLAEVPVSESPILIFKTSLLSNHVQFQTWKFSRHRLTSTSDHSAPHGLNKPENQRTTFEEE